MSFQNGPRHFHCHLTLFTEKYLVITLNSLSMLFVQSAIHFMIPTNVSLPLDRAKAAESVSISNFLIILKGIFDRFVEQYFYEQ